MPSALSVLFVNPFAGTPTMLEAERLKSYLAIGSLASALRDGPFLKRFGQRLAPDRLAVPEPVHVELLHLAGRPAEQTIFAFLAEHAAGRPQPPDILGVTATSAHLEEACELAAAASRLFPQALRVIGGPHVSVRPEETLRGSDFQVACVGEGVETMAELALRWPAAREEGLARVEGIAFKDATGYVHRNPPRRPLFLLDDYPFPSNSLDLFWPHLGDPRQNAGFPVSVLAGFGCPHDCIFCAQRRIHAGQVRERSGESIFSEVERLYARGFRRFAFVQETFLNNCRRVRRFCDLVRQSGLEIEWTVEARADQVRREGLLEMRSAGLKFIQLGVESGDEDLLRTLGKQVSREQIVRVTEWCRELRIHTAYYMLVGLPRQGWQSILRSALLVWENTPYNLLTRHVSVAIAIPYPGTRIARGGTVRVTGWTRRNWPERNPAVEVGDEGEFFGRAFTETDDMTADEIFEAWLYLDDFCHFLMDARLGDPNDTAARTKSMGYAEQLLYMIQRRTFRDLIVRARPDPTPSLRQSSLNGLSERDGHAERHFKDVAADKEQLFAPLLYFLSVARFENGFDTMRRLEIPSRLKWMKVCALAWLCTGKACRRIAFAVDGKETGEDLGRRLRGVRTEEVDRCLAAAETGAAPAADIQLLADGGLSVFGIHFRMDVQAGRLSVPARFG